MKHEIIGANVTRVEVFAAADAIANEKGKPTQNTVRIALGNRGSFGTISKYLRDWRETRGIENARIQVDLSEPQKMQVLAWAAGVLETVGSAFESKLAAREEDFRRHLAESEGSNAELCAEADRLLDEIQLLQHRLNSAEAKNQDLITQNDALTQKIAAGEEMVRAKTSALDELHRVLAAKDERLYKATMSAASRVWVPGLALGAASFSSRDVSHDFAQLFSGSHG